jgi:hypothetical protein
MTGDKMDNQDILDFLDERIEALTEKRMQDQEAGDFELDEYLAGVIDAYDIIRIRLLSDLNA